MKTNLYTQNYNIQSPPKSDVCADNKSFSSVSTDDSRCSKDSVGCSSEASSAARASANVSFKGNKTSFSEKDINIAVTLKGYANVKSNTREVWDFRTEINNGPYKPQLLYNRNRDERYMGDSTAIMFPVVHSDWRNTDNMTILISGKLPKEVASGLVGYLSDIGVLKSEERQGRTFYVNSDDPHNFMQNFKIKSAIAKYLTKAMQEYEQSPENCGEKKEVETTQNSSNSQNTQENAQTNKSDISNKYQESNAYKITTSSINISMPGRKQNPNNTRDVEDYTKFFIDNNRQFTVLKHGYVDNNSDIKDMSVILIPSVKEKGDFITVTIDGKHLSYDEAKKLVNSLVAKKVANPNNSNFRNAIVEFFNK